MSEKNEVIVDTTPPVDTGAEGTATGETLYAGKYKTVEELTAAYEALSAGKGAEGTEGEPSGESEAPKPDSLEIPEGESEGDDDDAAQKVVEGAGLDWAALNAEYAEHGKLSDETYARLDKGGIPRTEVDTYIAGKQAQADAYDAAVFGTAGGQEEYTSLVTWAKDSLTKAEKVAFNEAVTSGDAAKAKLAVEALVARKAAVAGTPPKNLLNGKKGATGVQPFASQSEMTEAMKSRRYKTDAAFRAEVVERLRLSTF